MSTIKSAEAAVSLLREEFTQPVRFERSMNVSNGLAAARIDSFQQGLIARLLVAHPATTVRGSTSRSSRLWRGWCVTRPT